MNRDEPSWGTIFALGLRAALPWLVLTACAIAVLAVSGRAHGALPQSGVVSLKPGSSTPIDAPLDVRGELSVRGDASRPAWLVNRQKVGFRPGIVVGEGDQITLSGVNLRGANWSEVFWDKAARAWRTRWTNNISLLVDGKTACGTLLDVGVADGTGVHLRECAWFIWTGNGGTVGPTYQYGLVIGDHTTGEVGRGVVIQDQRFDCGRKEAGVRVHNGENVVFRRCRFDVATDLARPAAQRHNKQAIQPRVMVGQFIDCTIRGSLEGGQLAPEIDKEHFAYGAEHPTFLEFNGGSVAGYTTFGGNSFVVIDGQRVTGRDPRGVGGECAYTIKTFTWAGRKYRPRLILTNVTNDAFGSLAGEGVIVGPGCYSRGNLVPISPGFDAAEMERIRKVARSGKRP